MADVRIKKIGNDWHVHVTSKSGSGSTRKVPGSRRIVKRISDLSVSELDAMRAGNSTQK